MASTIGIKIANGEFYPILEENSTVKKRLILTTVHNKQGRVHIDLYKSNTQTIADALYIGNLVIENIKSKLSGEPSIELTISSNRKGEISADAVDLDPFSDGGHHYLQVSLNSLTNHDRNNASSDFEIGYQNTPIGLYDPVPNKKNSSWLIALFIGGIAVCFLLWLFLFNGKERFNFTFFESTTASVKPSSDPLSSEPAVPMEAEGILVPEVQSDKSSTTALAPGPERIPAVEPDRSSTTALAPEPIPEVKPDMTAATASAPKPEPENALALEQEGAADLKPTLGSSVSEPLVVFPAEPPIIEAPASPPPRRAAPLRTRPRPPVASYKVPTTIPRGGVAYKIRWGDTLWDISEAFYRNPWLYPRIARFNTIRNPDLIISGKTIRIPPRK